MKKKNLIILMVALFVIIGGWAVYENTHKKTDYVFKDFCRLSTDTISRAEIRNGNTGEVTMVDDQDAIDELVDFMDEVTYKKVKKDPFTGWRYTVVLYTGDEQIASLEYVSDELCIVDGCAYKIKSDITSNVEKVIMESTEK